jgi:hypothetical protein
MHTGEFGRLDQAIWFYNSEPASAERDDIPGGGPYGFITDAFSRASIAQFLAGALTDPRVADERFPFDRPRLRTERLTSDKSAPSKPLSFIAFRSPARVVELSWEAPGDDVGVVDYVLRRDGAVIALLTDTQYTDRGAHYGNAQAYSLVARDAAQNASPAAVYRLDLITLGDR